MKNIKACLIALLLCVVTAGFILHYADDALPHYSISYGTWMDESKYGCSEGLQQVLQEDNTLPIFGSSELRHGMKTRYHAKAVFKNTDMKPMLIGQAGYQSLTHAMTVGAIGESMKEKKAVLILSPQWFKKGGVKEEAFGAAFSEDNFIHFLKNQKLSKETKDYMLMRVRELTKNNDAMYCKVNRDVKWYDENQDGALTSIQKNTHQFLVLGKAKTKLMLRKKIFMGKKPKRKVHKAHHNISEPKWDELYERAEKRGKVISRNNGFGMVDKAYKKGFRQFVEGKAKLEKANYSVDSKEFKDLECFIQICQNQGIEPMVVILPYNGKWYDYMGLKKEVRQEYYKKVNTILDQYHVKRSDLSNQEYASYYFRDNSHLLLKGLVDLNEHIYNFFEFDE